MDKNWEKCCHPECETLSKVHTISLSDSVNLENHFFSLYKTHRCAVIRIDPETGSVDDEPLKCLRKFRAQDDPQKISVDGTAPTFGIYCGLYSNGNVAIGDDVFEHV